MPISLNCSHCKTKIKVPDKAYGKIGKCPKCQGRVVIPVALPAKVSTPPTIPPNHLIVCSACNRKIAPNAKTCPGCGAANKWVHPEIQRFINASNTFTNTPPFQFSSEGYILRGWAEVRRGVMAQGDLGSKAIIIGFLCYMGGNFTFPALAALLFKIGPLILGGGLVIVFSSFLQSPQNSDLLVSFIIDFSQTPPCWKSDDDIYWQEIKTFFFKRPRS